MTTTLKTAKNMITYLNIDSSYNPSGDINKSFSEALTTIFNHHIKNNFPEVTTFDIEQGLFTSGEYGSYRVPCYDKNKNMLCYIICDVIMGNYKVYSGTYND